MTSAEDFIKSHFPGIEETTWYPALVAVAEGYSKKVKQRAYFAPRSFPIDKPTWENVTDKEFENIAGHYGLVKELREYQHIINRHDGPDSELSLLLKEYVIRFI